MVCCRLCDHHEGVLKLGGSCEQLIVSCEVKPQTAQASVETKPMSRLSATEPEADWLSVAALIGRELA